jgi:L-ascorbate metabolism protein UlaG (beta-lactamase superfamily)
VRNVGFKNVEVLQQDTVFEGIHLVKTRGEHGRGEELLKLMGEVCGLVFKHPSEKALYVAGDTVWYKGVQEELDTHKPDIIVVNGGDNQLIEYGALIMGKEDIYEVHKAAPNAKIISVHMEAVNHWTLSREELKNFSREKGFSSHILVPEDGQSYAF